MTGVLAEIRLAARVLSRHRLVAGVSILTLALGIGLTALAFSILNGVVLRGLPVDAPGDLRYIERTVAQDQAARRSVPLADYLEIAREQRSFEGLAAFSLETVNLSGTATRPERYSGARVTANLFDVLHIRPRLGRGFLAGEDAPGAPPVALVSDRIWKSHFGDAPAIGRETFRANGVTCAVVGVMPAGFLYPLNQDLWIAMSLDPALDAGGPGSADVVGRLRPGVSAASAQAELAALAARLAERGRPADGETALVLRTHTSKYLGDAAVNTFVAVFIAVVAVLLIAVVNVANLLLALATVRSRELAIRAALGATRVRLVGHLSAEAFVLAVAGGLVGLGLARAGVTWFRGAIAETNPPFWVDVRLDLLESLFVAALVVLVTLVVGATAAARASGARAGEILKDEGRGSSAGRLGWLRHGLVVVEVALSVALLLAAGLMVRTMLTVRTTDYGFSTRELLTAGVNLPAASYPDAERRQRFWNGLIERIERHPGVRAAALASFLPGTGTGRTTVGQEGVAYASPQDYPRIRSLVVSPGFFEALRLQLRAGRDFADGDVAGTVPVVIVNQAAALRFFGRDDPIGRRLLLAGGQGPPTPALVVGVAPRIALGGVRDQDPVAIYLPLAQHPQATLQVIVGTFGDELALASGLRDSVGALDPELPAYAVQSMTRALYLTTWFYGVFGALFVVFGAVALVMVASGLFGLMAFTVAHRTREIGVRMAMGARRADVLRLVLGQVAVQLAAGLVAGGLLAAWLGRLLVALLVGVQPSDPTVHVLIVGGLVATGLLASLGPALRATRIDPTDALRHT